MWNLRDLSVLILVQLSPGSGLRFNLSPRRQEEEAARAVNKAIRDAGLEGRRKTNAVDATGALVPKSGDHRARDRSAVVAPDPARAASETTSKYWGVSWHKNRRQWEARYQDADDKRRHIGSTHGKYFFFGNPLTVSKWRFVFVWNFINVYGTYLRRNDPYLSQQLSPSRTG